VNERNVLIAGSLVGALAGAAVGFMFFTDRGQRWRVSAERNLSAMMQEAERLLAAADQVRQSVGDLRGASGYPRSA
jgi:gas vesicle protein